MIGISRLLCGTENYGDSLRYSTHAAGQRNGATSGHGPVVVWNITRTCNLKCRHCYSNSDGIRREGELTTAEGTKFIDDLAAFKVPVLLLSGGEPLLRPDFFVLAARAKEQGLRVTVSTNGTLITPSVARDLKKAGVSYVGVSLDGIGANNDRFRGCRGAFDEALRGIRNCLAAGQKVGLRFTLTRHNVGELEDIFRLVEEENIPRICFYHLVYSGRGSAMIQEDISHEETRQALDLIINRTADFHRRGLTKEVLTVDNHADGIYLYLKLQSQDPRQAAEVLELLRLNGGNRTGIAIGEVDWEGWVHPDQFTRNHTFGNVRERPFSDIWTDLSHPILRGLKNRRGLLGGRCATCRWLDACNGNFRARAEAVYDDFWAQDPACYLTDDEIAKDKE